MAGALMNRNGGGGPRRRRRGGWTPKSEINLTPFVDVMLVLLIVFMVTAPLLTVGVPVDLPQANAQAITTPEEPLVVSVDANGRIFIQELEVTPVSLVPRLEAITDANPETRIYVRGDRVIPYGLVMEVMGMINEAGFRRVALLAEAPTPDVN
ncbi:MAG: protein TolR [Rhodospirillales bacterium]